MLIFCPLDWIYAVFSFILIIRRGSLPCAQRVPVMCCTSLRDIFSKLSAISFRGCSLQISDASVANFRETIAKGLWCTCGEVMGRPPVRVTSDLKSRNSFSESSGSGLPKISRGKGSKNPVCCGLCSPEQYNLPPSQLCSRSAQCTTTCIKGLVRTRCFSGVLAKKVLGKHKLGRWR